MYGHPVSRPCSRSMNMKHCSKMRVPRGCNYSKIAWLRQLFHLHYGSRQTTPHLSIPFPTLFTAESNRERIAFGPLLITVLFLALKKLVFLKKKFFPKKNIFFLPFFYATFQCGPYNVFKFFFFFFDHKKLKKPPSKVAHNRPKPFFFTVQN